MATIKRSIVFAPERKKKKGVLTTENVPIFMRVTFNSQRMDLSTGFKIDLDKWDDKTQRVKRNCMNKSMQRIFVTFVAKSAFQIYYFV